tara:strand:- start:1748 stop:2905 length:1158 start_codon:yes stop_codon:yes gene_type:complete
MDTNVYSQAKIEYTNQLIDVLKDRLYDRIYEIYTDSKRNTKLFRKELENIIKWNQEIIEIERSKIMERSKCEYIDDLITAVFISHTRILTSIGKKTSKKVNLVIPKTINFIHKCYINIAREIWKNPNLFDNRTTSSEYQKNIRIIENLIKSSIEYTIRSSLPVRDILRNHLSSDSNEDEEPPEENKEPPGENQESPKKNQVYDELNDYKKEEQVIDNTEPVYDNDNIIMSDDEEEKINSVIEADDNDDNDDNTDYKELIQEINNIKPTDSKEPEFVDKIDNEVVVVDKYNSNIDLFESIDNKSDNNDDDDDDKQEDDKKVDEENVDEETKIISDLEHKTSTNIKGITMIKDDDKTEVEIDDTETIDGILGDIDKINNDEEYTLFE